MAGVIRIQPSRTRKEKEGVKVSILLQMVSVERNGHVAKIVVYRE